MAQFFSENWGNLLVLALVTAALGGVLWSLRNSRRAGHSGCGCGCGGCPSRGICHPDEPAGSPHSAGKDRQ
ncbi:MAG: FeoB-associated Cys-rich membrane protein [Oscillospiraceae bacterium]